MRYSGVDLSDGQVDGGEMQIASLGVNWWLTPFFSFGVNYRYIWNQQGEHESSSSGVVGRILLMLE
jgi:phosphate-selective porin